MKKTISIKWRTLKYLLTFVFLILLCLFIFQTVLLRPFYKEIKTKDIKTVAQDISNNISDENLDKYIQSKTLEKEMCILVVNENEGFTSSNDYACPLMRLSPSEFIEYTKLAIENGGTYLLETSFDSVNFENINNTLESLTYIMVDRYAGNNYVIMVNTNITPLNATIKTIYQQLIIVGIIVLISTLILSLLLTNRVIKPLEEMNESAKLLPKGKYEKVNDGKLKEIYELNNTLNEASNEIMKADKTKRELISNVSHDLRTPLTLISSYGEMMIDMPNERTDENIQVIIDESKRLNELVNDLLDLSKIQENKLVLNLSDFNITKLLKDLVLNYSKVLNKYMIKLEYNNEVIINGDIDRISQVLGNFINNAINYSNGDITLRQYVEDDIVCIEVIDLGKGIKEEDLPNIWDRYYKVDESHERPSKGSGIGLSIAKEILELHNYEYGVKSEIDKGSIFYFKVPIVKIIEK